MAELARPAAAAVARQLARGELPDGPVVMWAAVIAVDGTLLAAAPVPGPGVWNWYRGELITRLPVTPMPVIASGPVGEVWLVAVNGHQWAPVTPLVLSEHPPEWLTVGDTLLLRDSKIKHNFGGAK